MADEDDFMDTEEDEITIPKLAPWVEKYRPEKVDDVAHQDEVVKTLKKSIELGSVPHLLFHGPPGTGKTTTALALARSLYGPELYRSRTLELNASDERGIKVVREKIKNFAQGAVSNQKIPGYPCPRFKLIILDEADTMTPDAQSALRRIIENHSKVTRFCMICNYVTRIIEPLASRCAKFRFKPLPVVSMKERITDIATREGVKVTDSSLDALLTASKGDMRKAVTYLQSSHQLTQGKKVITPEIVADVSGAVPVSVMEKLWKGFYSPTFDLLKEIVMEVVFEGFPMATILSQVHDTVVTNNTVSDLDKAFICQKLAEAESHLIDGASEQLQLLDVAAFINRRFIKFAAEVDKRSAADH